MHKNKKKYLKKTRFFILVKTIRLLCTGGHPYNTNTTQETQRSVSLRICCRFWLLSTLFNMVFPQARALGLSQYAKAVTQSIGGRTAITSFPSLRRDEWYKREEDLPSMIPAFANHVQLNKLVVGQTKKVFNLKAQLFNNKSQSMSGIGGTTLKDFQFVNY